MVKLEEEETIKRNKKRTRQHSKLVGNSVKRINMNVFLVLQVNNENQE